jgi:tetratricopeptide (TPR) repeat protein
MPIRQPHLSLRGRCRYAVTRPRMLRAAWCLAPLVALSLSIRTGQVAAEPIAVRSQQLALHYHFAGGGTSTRVVLWYTRDRGATWHRFGEDPDGRSPFVFEAPAEGLYGFILIADDGSRTSSPDPRPNDTPQRWVFVDYTPPLLQWHAIEPDEDFATRRVLRLRWTAYDDHLLSRPITIAYQHSVDQQWQTIAEDLANTGRYDWTVPAELNGQVTLKITARDRGGHVVERLYGPLRLSGATPPVEAPEPEEALASTQPAPASLHDHVPASQPSVDPMSAQLAEQRYKQGAWHLLRGQYPLAAERFREALELDPAHVAVHNDLAGIHYLKEDYGQAIEFYERALTLDRNDRQALRGAALAYVARRQYAESRTMLGRLLALNDRDGEALLDLGDVLFMMGERIDALGTWRRALEADPSAAEVIGKARQRLELYKNTPPGTGTTVVSGADGGR